MHIGAWLLECCCNHVKKPGLTSFKMKGHMERFNLFKTQQAQMSSVHSWPIRWMQLLEWAHDRSVEDPHSWLTELWEIIFFFYPLCWGWNVCYAVIDKGCRNLSRYMTWYRKSKQWKMYTKTKDIIETFS